MRNNIKKYYQLQFGSFSSISAKEIQELNNYELHLLELPLMFYKKNEASKPELKKKLQTLLTLTKN